MRVVDHLPGTKDTRRHQLLRHHGPRGPRPADHDQLPRQPDQGRLRRGRAEFQSDVRISRDDGALISGASMPSALTARLLCRRSQHRFPPSRNLDSMSIAVPQGFRLAGVYCGVKRNTSKLDLSLIVSDRPAVAAGVYTQNLRLRRAGGARSSAHAGRATFARSSSTRATPTPAPASAA